MKRYTLLAIAAIAAGAIASSAGFGAWVILFFVSITTPVIIRRTAFNIFLAPIFFIAIATISAVIVTSYDTGEYSNISNEPFSPISIRMYTSIIFGICFYAILSLFISVVIPKRKRVN